MDNPETVATFATKDTGRRQSRDTGNIRHTRHRTKTIQRQWQHLSQKTQDKDNSETVATLVTQDKDNPETLVTFVTKDTGRRQFRDSGNICHKRHRTKTIQRQWQHLPQRHRTKTIQRQWQHLPQKTQDEDNSETVATFATKDIGQRQFRDSGNICHKRHRTKTIQRQWQHLSQKTQDEDNPETVATFVTKDTGQRQFRDTGNICHKGHRQFRDSGNICHKRHRTKTKKTNKITQNRKLKR